MSKWHQILRGFMKSKNKQILKVTALYLIWNPKSVKCPASISENPVPLFAAFSQKLNFKVQVFPSWFESYLVNVISTERYNQNFVASLENLNCTLLTTFNETYFSQHGTPLCCLLKYCWCQIYANRYGYGSTLHITIKYN